jgi:hypothetical protein
MTESGGNLYVRVMIPLFEHLGGGSVWSAERLRANEYLILRLYDALLARPHRKSRCIRSLARCNRSTVEVCSERNAPVIRTEVLCFHQKTLLLQDKAKRSAGLSCRKTLAQKAPVLVTSSVSEVQQCGTATELLVVNHRRRYKPAVDQFCANTGQNVLIRRNHNFHYKSTRTGNGLTYNRTNLLIV